MAPRQLVRPGYADESTPGSVLKDAVVLLCLYDRSQVHGRQRMVGDRLKAMKIAYLAARELAAQRLSGLSLTFYRWTWGPLSNDVYYVWSLLCDAGLMEEEELFSVTASGSRLADAFWTEVLRSEANRPFMDVLESVARRYGPLGTDSVLQEVYELPEVQRAKKGDTLLAPPQLHPDAIQLSVDEGWLETIAILLDPKAHLDLLRAEHRARSGRKLSRGEVWGELAG